MKSVNGLVVGLRQRRTSAILGILSGLLLLMILTWPALAAAELDFFRGQSGENELILEWATLAEENLLRWAIYCKDELQPPEAFHLIGTADAVGEGGNGGFYTFPVPDLTPGASYCFRITEISTDETTGESYEICGYGYGVTPTPTPMPTPTSNVGVVSSGTASALSVPVAGDGSLPPQSAPTSTWTPVPAQQAAPVAATETPTATPVGESPIDYTDADASLPAGGAEPSEIAQSGSPASTNGADEAALAAAVSPTPDPGYIVVTATPTTQAIAAQLQPTFTPLPTATAVPAALTAGFSDWGVENLVLATLCFVFFGAGGLGILGITSLGLYVRSRSGARDRRRSSFDNFRR